MALAAATGNAVELSEPSVKSDDVLTRRERWSEDTPTAR